MVKPSFIRNAKGFSLVELLVALLFTSFLMAGLAAVFKASLSTFYTSGENLSNVRRNRMSIDLLSEDINLAGMYLTDLAAPPMTLEGAPPFYILPNQLIDNANPDNGDPRTSDELYFYLDEPLPFEGTLKAAPVEQTAAHMVLDALEGKESNPSSNFYTVDCSKNDYAELVKEGQVAIFKDFWEAVYVVGLTRPSETSVSFRAGAAPNAGITGSGPSGLPSRASHIVNTTKVLFVKPAQMVRYRIEMVELDPIAGAIPCLVRDQGVYAWDGSGFKPAPGIMQQIITENVSGFKVYLSVNGGVEWAGRGFEDAGGNFETGWNSSTGIRGLIDKQLRESPHPIIPSTRGHEHWFRSVPTLVRVDVTTRTATKRTEFSESNQELAHRELTQSLIFLPKHFGLPMN